MINNRNCYVILTAKKESKRLQNKLWLKLNEKYLWQYGFETISNSDYIDHIVICTDDERFLNMVCYNTNKTVYSIPEPDILLQKQIIDVLKYSSDKMNYKSDDFIIWIDLCNPFIKLAQLKTCIEQMEKYNYHSLFETKKVRYNIYGLENEYDEFYHSWSIRIRTKKTIDNSTNKWGIGIDHGTMNIAEDYEISIDYPHDLIIAEALLRNGY